ncbi:MAG: InlB B-repeat-containing protein, partial [Oscillospiraceae bacterium]|nr:InlB B-repeat-containing protein [Oscillospiraceae bacterium]
MIRMASKQKQLNKILALMVVFAMLILVMPITTNANAYEAFEASYESVLLYELNVAEETGGNELLEEEFVFELDSPAEAGYAGITLLNAPAATHTANDLGELIAHITSAGGLANRVINVPNNITLTSVIDIPEGRHITLVGTGAGVRTIHQTTANNRHFTVNYSNSTLELWNITLRGNQPAVTHPHGGVEVLGGTLIMNEGSVISHNLVIDVLEGGGGVLVYGDTASIIMQSGARVSDNRGLISQSPQAHNAHFILGSVGGGMTVVFGSAYILSGAEVSRNSAPNGGGIHLARGATLTIDGGLVTRNTAIYNGTHPWTGNGGGVNLRGYAANATSLILNSGEISYNVSQWREDDREGGGGVSMTGHTSMVMRGGSIRENTSGTAGGGLYIRGDNSARARFRFYGGEIVGNHARGSNLHNVIRNDGGGVMVVGEADFYMIDEPGFTRERHISYNIARRGAGVAVSEWVQSATIPPERITRFIMDGDSNITYNRTSASGVARGIGVAMQGGVFTMRNGLISGNEQLTTGLAHGGGVSFGASTTSETLNRGTTFRMYNGTISDHEVTGTGGGIYLSGNGPDILHLMGGHITNNIADGNGGGLHVTGQSKTVNISGAQISGNTSNAPAGTAAGGGGISIVGGGTNNRNVVDVMAPTLITNNTATYSRGGGVLVSGNNSRFYMQSGSITNNHARLYGGGIFTAQNQQNNSTVNVGLGTTLWGNLDIGAAVVFSENTSELGAFRPPLNYNIPELNHILTRNVSPTMVAPIHPLNNFDINYNGGFNITFNRGVAARGSIYEAPEAASVIRRVRVRDSFYYTFGPTGMQTVSSPLLPTGIPVIVPSEGWRFRHWARQAATGAPETWLTEQYIWDLVPTASITFTAHYETDLFFDANFEGGPAVVGPVVVGGGTTINIPEASFPTFTRPGWNARPDANRWSRDSAGTDDDFWVTPTTNVTFPNATIYAQWQADVTFDLNGGTINGNYTIPSITMLENATLGANVPGNPTRYDGVEFSRWAWESAPGVWTTFDANTPMTMGNVTVVAQFEDEPPTFEIWNWSDLSQVLEMQNDHDYTHFVLMQDIGIPGQPAT